MQSSEIEGETINKDPVRSSIARRLGMDIGALPTTDRQIEGIVEMTCGIQHHFDKPLTKERLFDWHGAMFPTGRSGLVAIRVGAWRDEKDGPRQVVSGPMGREKIHFVAPPASKLDVEMNAFFDWFNHANEADPVIKAGLAHLWFVSIHPFEDGNGRIARAVADMALARSENSPQRFYSLSAQIQQERKAYYNLLEQTQKNSLDVTPWLEWFLDCLLRAINNAEMTLTSVLFKARFWDRVAQETLNDRQRLVLNCLLDGFEGHLSTSKWAKLTNTFQDTAYRDIMDLVNRSILVRAPQGGRSTHYCLTTDHTE